MKKAIIINNKRALIIDIVSSEQKEDSNMIDLRISVNPVVGVSVDSSSTYIIESDDLDNLKETSYVFAESLVGPEGIITTYTPSNKNHDMKLTKKVIKKPEN